MSFVRPQRRVPNRLLQDNIELGQLFAKPTDVSGNSAIDTADRSSVPITLGSQHFDHLSAPRDQRHQFTGLRIRQRSSLRLNDFGKMRQYSSVDRVGFRQSTRGAPKSRTWRGLTTATGRPAAANSLAAAISSHRWLSTRCAYTQLLPTFNQGRNPALIINHVEALIAGRSAASSLALETSIPTNTDFPPLSPTLSPSLRDTGLIDPGDCSGPASFCSGRDLPSARARGEGKVFGAPASPLERYVNLQNHAGVRTNVGKTGTVLSDVADLLEIETGHTR